MSPAVLLLLLPPLTTASTVRGTGTCSPGVATPSEVEHLWAEEGLEVSALVNYLKAIMMTLSP